MTLARRLLHGATLAFTAVWLLATSRAPSPAVECFVPLRAKTLAITLGARRPPAPNAAPTCAGLDHLAEGSVIRVELGRGAAPPEVSDGTHVCWSYGAKKLEGPAGISATEDQEPTRFHPTALAWTSSAFDSPGSHCTGQHRLTVIADQPFRAGLRLDPRAAGAEPWLVTRVISLKSGQKCPAAPALRDDFCEDTFLVKGIADAP